ncbi:hypothetical protein PIB30_044460 [Stylosanthes scabra]|uniref:Uncharacterized protein n=1 Tax=Stylosanthes scabra TaxID=79078 RepID=A0ABU6TFI9_9FABA|nr:hypothetical protein [Stylosanthes scabra]
MLGRLGEYFSFHENLQCSSDLQGTAGGGPARPLRRSSQIGRTLMSLSEEILYQKEFFKITTQPQPNPTHSSSVLCHSATTASLCPAPPLTATAPRFSLTATWSRSLSVRRSLKPPFTAAALTHCHWVSFSLRQTPSQAPSPCSKAQTRPPITAPLSISFGLPFSPSQAPPSQTRRFPHFPQSPAPHSSVLTSSDSPHIRPSLAPLRRQSSSPSRCLVSPSAVATLAASSQCCSESSRAVAICVWAVPTASSPFPPVFTHHRRACV